MTGIFHYDSPLGGITLSGNEGALTGLWFDGQKYFGASLPKEYEEKPLPVFRQVSRPAYIGAKLRKILFIEKRNVFFL